MNVYKFWAAAAGQYQWRSRGKYIPNIPPQWYETQRDVARAIVDFLEWDREANIFKMPLNQGILVGLER